MLLQSAAKHAQTCHDLGVLMHLPPLHMVDGQPDLSPPSLSLDPPQQGCSSVAAAVVLLCTQCSLALLKQEMHNVWIKIRQKEMEGKGMMRCYPRQVENYYTWFEQKQSRMAADDPSQAVLPAFPVTAAKAAVFLHHESTYEKVPRL